jgi:hypothetical protein
MDLKNEWKSQRTYLQRMDFQQMHSRPRYSVSTPAWSEMYPRTPLQEHLFSKKYQYRKDESSKTYQYRKNKFGKKYQYSKNEYSKKYQCRKDKFSKNEFSKKY